MCIAFLILLLLVVCLYQILDELEDLEPMLMIAVENQFQVAIIGGAD